MKTKTEVTDVIVTNCGSLFTFQPLTQEAKNWIEERVSDDAQFLGDSLCVEHRYAGDLASGMILDGLELE